MADTTKGKQGQNDDDLGASMMKQPEGTVEEPLDKPSQAEGDLETVDADLRSKEAEGKLPGSKKSNSNG
jgi:hypothetical protein